MRHSELKIKLKKLTIFGKSNCAKLGKFIKGDSGTGYACEFKKGNRTFVSHSRTKKGLKKIMNYYYSKGWGDSKGFY